MASKTEAAKCERCAGKASTTDSIQCMGFCDHRAHHKCLPNMNGQLAKILAGDRNLFWMCNECVKLMELTRFRDVILSLGSVVESLTTKLEAVHNDAIAELKSGINKNGEKLEQLTSHAPIVLNQAPPSVNRPYHDYSRALKRRRGEDTGPKSTLVMGKKAADGDKVVTIPPPEDMFWLYVTRFLNNTTSAQVMAYIKEAIGKDEQVMAIPLVKRGVNPATLPFISFKVGVAVKHKAAVMNPEVWPGGCAFREFEDLPQRFDRPVYNVPDRFAMGGPTRSPAAPVAWSTPRSENLEAAAEDTEDSDSTMMEDV